MQSIQCKNKDTLDEIVPPIIVDVKINFVTIFLGIGFLMFVILFWSQDLLIRYTLDVMHCEQNLSKDILKTNTRHKNTVKVRRNLQHRGIKKHLWLTSNPKKPGKMLNHTAPYVLTSEEFDIFAHIIESLKAPPGHISTHISIHTEEEFGGGGG